MKNILRFSLFSLTISLAQAEHMTPESTLNQFMTAVIQGDKAKASILSLPNPDFDFLFSAVDSKASKEQQIRELSTFPYRVMKDGEVFIFANGQTLAIGPEIRERGYIVITNDIDPIPHYLKKTEGGWRVDPRSLIALRRFVYTNR